jgi:hypothetical protein
VKLPSLVGCRLQAGVYMPEQPSYLMTSTSSGQVCIHVNGPSPGGLLAWPGIHVPERPSPVGCWLPPYLLYQPRCALRMKQPSLVTAGLPGVAHAKQPLQWAAGYHTMLLSGQECTHAKQPSPVLLAATTCLSCRFTQM